MTRRVGAVSKALFFRCLQTMFSAGVPFHQACFVLGTQLEPPRLRGALARMAERMGGGWAPHRAMAEHPDCFDTVDISLLRLALTTGSMAEVLEQLASFYEAGSRLQHKTTAALLYPLGTLALCLLLVVLGPPLLFSGLFTMLTQSKVPLPWLTRGLIGFSDLVRSPLCWVLLGVGVVALLSWPDRERRARQLDGLGRRLYLVGPVLCMRALSRFARALSLGSRAGLPVHESLELAAGCSGSPVLAEALGRAREDLLEGRSLSGCLRRTGQFPPMFVMTLVAGEESGDYAGCLRKLAGLYELELECRLEAFSASLAPLVTVVVGAVTGLLNLAVLLPIVTFVERL